MKILVTGASGFVGMYIAKVLAKNHEVIATYRRDVPTELQGNDNITLLKVDFSKPVNLSHSCEIVVHTAADTPSTTKNESQMWESNVVGTNNLLKWCKNSGVNKIFYCSSVAVYGETKNLWVSESTVIHNPSYYGKTKFEAEKAIQKWLSNDNSKYAFIIRLSGILGKKASGTFIPNMIKKLKEGNEVNVYSKTALFNNILDIEDLVNCIDNWINNERKKNFTLINAASDEPMTLEEIAKTAMQIMNKKSRICENYEGRKPFLISTKNAERNNFPIRTTKENFTKYINFFI